MTVLWKEMYGKFEGDRVEHYGIRKRKFSLR